MLSHNGAFDYTLHEKEGVENRMGRFDYKCLSLIYNECVTSTVWCHRRIDFLELLNHWNLDDHYKYWEKL